MRLPRIATLNGHYTLVELDQLESVAILLGLDPSQKENDSLLKATHDQLAKVARSNVSGVVLDPNWGLSWWGDDDTPGGAGVLLRVNDLQQEKAAVTVPDSPTLPKLNPNWGIDHIRANYAVALLSLKYHPAEKEAADKKQFVAEIADYCRYQDIDLVLKLDLGSEGQPALSPEEFLFAADEFHSSCQLLIMPPANDALTAATLTVQLDIPWVVALTAEKYDQLKEQLRLALEGGARGFYVGSPLWSDLSELRQPETGPSEAAIEAYMEEKLRDRYLELSRITSESVSANDR